MYEDSSEDLCSQVEEESSPSELPMVESIEHDEVPPIDADAGTRSHSLQTSGEESPVKKMRTIKEIYKTYTFALIIADPITFEEAAKTKVWKEAMKEELATIKHNDTWVWWSFHQTRKW